MLSDVMLSVVAPQISSLTSQVGQEQLNIVMPSRTWKSRV